MRFLIDRTELPYDAMVPDPSWLIPVEEEGDGNEIAASEINTTEEPNERDSSLTTEIEG